MPWTEITRAKYRREGVRYASDMTDAEWSLIAPMMPKMNRIGRPRETDLRAVANAILYMAATGCQWRQLPKEFPPYSTVQEYFYRWSHDGTWLRINHALVMKAREQVGREASPTAGVIDSQSVKTTESGGPRGFDAGKKINGRKRHLLVDTLGLLLRGIVHPASVQDRDGLALLLVRIRRRFPFLALLFADGGYQGEVAAATAGKERLELAIVKRSDRAQGFVLLPRRWVVERSFAWFGRNRRLARDVEHLIASSTAMLYLAAIRLLTRRLATP